jgi:hypothetical protein
VSPLTFAQPARRSFLAPILLALVVLGVVIAIVIFAVPNRSPQLTITRTTVFATHTVLKNDSIVVGKDQSQDDLYVFTTLRIDDPLKFPLFLKDFTATLTTADGEELTSSAVEKQDLPTIYSAFPALKSLASDPLLRETAIPPGQSAEGMVLLHFPVTQATWDHRKNATLNVDFYHQKQQGVLIGSTNQTTHTPQTSQQIP